MKIINIVLLLFGLFGLGGFAPVFAVVANYDVVNSGAGDCVSSKNQRMNRVARETTAGSIIAEEFIVPPKALDLLDSCIPSLGGYGLNLGLPSLDKLLGGLADSACDFVHDSIAKELNESVSGLLDVGDKVSAAIKDASLGTVDAHIGRKRNGSRGDDRDGRINQYDNSRSVWRGLLSKNGHLSDSGSISNTDAYRNRIDWEKTIR